MNSLSDKYLFGILEFLNKEELLFFASISKKYKEVMKNFFKTKKEECLSYVSDTSNDCKITKT